MRLKITLLSLSLVALSFTACGEREKEVLEGPTTRTEVPPPIENDTREVKKSVETTEVAVAEEDSAPVDGAVVFEKCVGCHGANAETSALGKSQVIKGWEKQRIVDALKGYKSGTYGGDMKGLMKGQAAPLSNSEIEAVADHISKL